MKVLLSQSILYCLNCTLYPGSFTSMYHAPALWIFNASGNTGSNYFALLLY